MSLYEIEQTMFSALVDKLKELVTDGTVNDVIVGFEEDYPDDYPVIYVEIADESFEAVTPNKDQYVMSLDVVVEHFDSDYREGQERVREVAMRVYEKLVNDRTLSDAVDVLNVTNFDTEVTALPDGFLFEKTLSVDMIKWLFG